MAHRHTYFQEQSTVFPQWNDRGVHKFSDIMDDKWPNHSFSLTFFFLVTVEQQCMHMAYPSITIFASSLYKKVWQILTVAMGFVKMWNVDLKD